MPRRDLAQVRRGTAATWAAVNPVLAEGEAGLETDALKLKYGDGVTAYNSLAYVTGSGGVLDPLTTLLGNPITAVELDYLSGVTSNVQTQIDGKTANGHAHIVANVTGLQAALDAKADDGHAHTIADVTALQASLDTIAERLPILYDGVPNVNQTATGPQSGSFAAGATISVMDCVRLGSAGKWVLIDADAAATSTGLVAIALEAKLLDQAMLVALPGSFVRSDAWNWTIGAVLYLSTTAGQITETQPSGVDDVIRVVGYAVSADVIWFDPSPDYITHV